jgi:hypothetical protein
VPSQAFTHQAVAAVPIDRVWAALQLPETWKGIGGVTAVTNPRFDQIGLAGYHFAVAVAGKEHHGRATRIEGHPNRRMAMEIDTELLGGRITVDLEPNAASTSVTLRMDIASRGFRAGLLFPVISNAVGGSFPEAVERFVSSLASVESPTDRANENR